MNTNTKRVLIVATYLPDDLQSMERYAQTLVRIYEHEFVSGVSLQRPPVVFGSIFLASSLLSKYLAYVDKYILFFLWLVFISRAYDLIHVVDHGYSLYSYACPRARFVITCHDLLAVRGAFGDSSAFCNPSFLGPYLQRLILAGLRFSRRIVFVSHSTQYDYRRLLNSPIDQKTAIIYNPLNAPFYPDHDISKLEYDELDVFDKKPFLLLVGSSLPRKNRILALDLLKLLGPQSPYYLVFAGSPLSSFEKDYIGRSFLKDRIISLIRPRHVLLNALYTHAHALLFPSYAEGFGWPLIEAQACRCPVIASTTTSIPEVAGDGAFYADPEDVEAFRYYVLALEAEETRTKMIQLGSENLKRFDIKQVTQAYHQFAF